MVAFYKIMPAVAMIAVSLLPTGASAERISAERALERLHGKTAAGRLMSAPVSLVATETRGDEPVFYVFSAGDGYTVASADDQLAPVMAVVDHGSYDRKHMNPAASDWLDMLADEIEYCYSHPEALRNVEGNGFEDFTRKPIAPMISTKWDQDSPYNDRCPDVVGGRAMSGCVATAMAMVANWHRYPERGHGEHSYVHLGNRYSYNFEETTFDWDNMCDTYDSSSTEEQRAAVAELMLACGMGVEMKYGSDQSGAYSQLIPFAMINFLGYSRDAKYVPREFYTVVAWDRLVYKTLESEGPVIYNGRGAMGGHQFVCDGYSENGLFHFNWGWSGDSDGYFRLTALNPASLGIGGGSGGFNSAQAIITGLHKPVEGEEEAMPNLVSSGKFRSTVTKNVEWRFTSNEGVYSLDDRDVTVSLGVRLIAEDGSVTYYTDGKEKRFSPLSHYLNIKCVSSWTSDLTEAGLAPGLYRATPAFRWNDRWADIPQQCDYASYVEVNVKEDGTIEYSNKMSDAMYDLEVLDFHPLSDIEDGNCEFTIEVFNYSPTRYSGMLVGHVLDYDVENELTTFDVDVTISTQRSLRFDFKCNLGLEKSFYKIYFTDDFGKIVSPLFNVLGGKMLESIAYNEEKLTVSVGETVPLVINCLPEDAAFKRFAYEFTDNGNLAEADRDGMITGVNPGETQLIVRTLDGSALETIIDVEVLTPAGIDSAETGGKMFDVYTITGILIDRNVAEEDLPKLPGGIYILRNEGKTLKFSK